MEIDTLNVENAPNPENSKTPPPDENKTADKDKIKKADTSRESHTTTQNPHQKCAFYRNKLSYYISRMRTGYKANQYPNLEGKRREYQRKLWRYCREGVLAQPQPKTP